MYRRFRALNLSLSAPPSICYGHASSSATSMSMVPLSQQTRDHRQLVWRLQARVADGTGLGEDDDGGNDEEDLDDRKGKGNTPVKKIRKYRPLPPWLLDAFKAVVAECDQRDAEGPRCPIEGCGSTLHCHGGVIPRPRRCMGLASGPIWMIGYRYLSTTLPIQVLQQNQSPFRAGTPKFSTSCPISLLLSFQPGLPTAVQFQMTSSNRCEHFLQLLERLHHKSSLGQIS